MLYQVFAGALLLLAGFSTVAPAQTIPGGSLHWSASRPLVLAEF
jgi:hypothetical protein